MNYVIQRGKVRQQAINVPEGLPEILSDITREVLRCQPSKECLCQFIIDYLHSVIVTREKAMVAKTILDRALIQVESIISDLCVCDLSKEKTEMMAQVMEDCFRNFLEKRRCEMRRGKELIKFEDIDMLEELLQRCSFTDEELNASRPSIESGYKRFVDAYMSAAEGTRGTEILYQYFRDRKLKRIQDELRESAATAIQAAWRGFYVRKNFPKDVCTCTCMEEEPIDEEEMRKDKSARIIQRFFRNLAVRITLEMPVDPCWEIPSILEVRSEDAGTGSAVISDTQHPSAQEAEKPDEDTVELPAKVPTEAPVETPAESKAPLKAEEEKPTESVAVTEVTAAPAEEAEVDEKPPEEDISLAAEALAEPAAPAAAEELAAAEAPPTNEPAVAEGEPAPE